MWRVRHVFCSSPPADRQKSSTCWTQATGGVHQQCHAWLRLGTERKYERLDKRRARWRILCSAPPPLPQRTIPIRLKDYIKTVQMPTRRVLDIKLSHQTNLHKSEPKRRAKNISTNLTSKKGKAVPLQARKGPEGSRKLRFPDSVTTAQDSSRLSALRTGRLYPQEKLLILIYVRRWPHKYMD